MLQPLPDQRTAAAGVGETKLSVDEANVIGGALEMTSKTVACCMTPLKVQGPVVKSS